MKQKSESPVSVFSFPPVLSKLQSGSLFTKTNLQSSFLISLSPVPLTLRKSLESPQLFLSYLEGLYKESGFEASKLQSASAKIEYLHALYLRVADKGGWAQVAGRDYWQNLALSYEVEPRKLREDYESFLFALERVSEEGNFKNSGQVISQASLKLMKSAEFVRPGTRPLGLDSTKVKNLFERLAVVVPALACLGFGINFKAWAGTWAHSSSPLEAWAERYEEISSKVLKSLHWDSEDNLLKYSNKVPGLTAPQFNWIEDKKLFNCLPLSGMTKVWMVAEGQPEVFGFTKAALERLNDVLRKDFLESNEAGLQAWTPNEEFLLSHNVEFFYIKLCIGDLMISQSQLTWVFLGESCVIDWALLPVSSIPTFAEDYFADSSGLPVNFPLMVVEYLNRFIGEIDSVALEILKKVINESIEDECWTGSYTLELTEHLFCSSCSKALFWRYATYQTEAFGEVALCLKCQLISPRPCFKHLEKFSPVELDTFLSRIESNISSQIQTKLARLPLAPSSELRPSVLIDPEQLKALEDSLVLSKAHSAIDSAPLSHTHSEESYLRKGKKKLKICEFSDNKEKEDNRSDCPSPEDFDEDLARRTRKGLKDKHKAPNGKSTK